MGGGEGEKTEKATPKKRRDERKKGNVFMSKDAVAVATLFASILVLRLMFASAAESIGEFTLYCMELIRGGLVDGISDNLMIQGIALVARVAGPMMAVGVVVAAAATMAQTRLLVTAEPLKPKFSKINPISGFKNLFSLKSVVQALMGMIKIIILLILIYVSLRDLVGVAGKYLYADVSGSVKHFLLAIFTMLLKVGMAFLVLAAIDFLYQWWEYERKMRMSKQEVKEEYKQIEGDPQIKGRIKQLQRQMAQSRMMQQVPQADVIIRNPTHVAVALRYHVGEDEAPIVLAMGIDFLAERIIAVAEEHNIAVIENVPLARALYAEADLNRPIPTSLYEEVAEVMVYLYKLDRIQAPEDLQGM